LSDATHCKHEGQAMIFGPSCTIDGAGYRLFGNRAGATIES
jgi:hypothetical protein